MDRILVLVARLEDRLNRTTPACTAANDVFASTRLRDSVRIEALVLKAHCEKIHGMKAQSRQTLAQLSTDAEALKALSPYTARLHQNMLRQP